MEQPAAAVTAAGAAAVPRPFRFFTSLILPESTGLRASTLPVLAKILREVPESCVYYHTHHFLLQHHYLSPEPANDFAYWVTAVLGEGPLGELLASIDVTQHASLKSLREAIGNTIDAYLEHNAPSRLKFVSEGQEFFFIKSLHIVMPTRYVASTLEEFAQILEHISIRSLYYHIFDARLRVGRSTNDFSRWLTGQLGLTELAEQVSQLDPYAHTLETLRQLLLSMVRGVPAR